MLPGGTITTVAGPGSSNGALGDGGPATSATLSQPEGVAVDAAGNIYIADTGHNRVRMVSGGTITTVAGGGTSSTSLGDGGQATAARLSAPTSLTLDAAGNLYILDSGHNRVRFVSTAGVITTYAGNGTGGYSGDGGSATIAAIAAPTGYLEFDISGPDPEALAVDGQGNLYIADAGNGRVRMVGPDGTINTIAGGGQSSANNVAATSTAPSAEGLALGSQGEVYVSEPALDSFGDGDVRLLSPSATPVLLGPTIAAHGVAAPPDWGQGAQLAQGAWASIYGSYLAPDSRQWTNPDFNGINAPTSLDGTSVTIGGQLTAVSYISPGQVNVQVPTNTGTGVQPLVVSTPYGQSATYNVRVNGVEPGLLAPSSFNIDSTQYVVAIFPDGTYALPTGAISGVASRPAQAGDVIMLWGVGFGAVSPNVPAGQVAPSSSTLALPFAVKIGGTEATVSYAGLAPDEVGVYQFNVVVPALNSKGAVPLTFTLDGVPGTQQLYLSTQ